MPRMSVLLFAPEATERFAPGATERFAPVAAEDFALLFLLEAGAIGWRTQGVRQMAA